MQTDSTQDTLSHAHLLIAGTAEVAGEVVNGNEGPQRVGDICVDARFSMEHEAPENTLGVEIAEVDPAENAVGGQEEVQSDEQPAGAGDALDFAQGLFQVGKVAQAVADEDAVKGGGVEGEKAAIGADGVLDVALAAAEA